MRSDEISSSMRRRNGTRSNDCCSIVDLRGYLNQGLSVLLTCAAHVATMGSGGRIGFSTMPATGEDKEGKTNPALLAGFSCALGDKWFYPPYPPRGS